MSENKKILGKDLKLTDTDLGVDLALSSKGDIETVTDELNLGQAIAHRLRTTRGELFDTGHSSYGSRLYDLIGEPNTEATRERVKAIVRETLQQDPRIKEIVGISAKPRKGSLEEQLHAIDVDITVIAISSNVPLNIVFPFYLEVT